MITKCYVVLNARPRKKRDYSRDLVFVNNSTQSFSRCFPRQLSISGSTVDRVQFPASTDPFKPSEKLTLKNYSISNSFLRCRPYPAPRVFTIMLGQCKASLLYWWYEGSYHRYLEINPAWLICLEAGIREKQCSSPSLLQYWITCWENTLRIWTAPIFDLEF